MWENYSKEIVRFFSNFLYLELPLILELITLSPVLAQGPKTKSYIFLYTNWI